MVAKSTEFLFGQQFLITQKSPHEIKTLHEQTFLQAPIKADETLSVADLQRSLMM
jgi:hypothetical protein